LRIIEPRTEKYLELMTKNFDGKIGEIQEYAHRQGLPVVEPPTARFIATLLSALRPKQVLEIGCCIGFSAALMSEFLADNGHITTIERYGVMIEKARENIEKYELSDKITLLEGDAIDILPTLNKKFNFIFLDAAKGQYLRFLPHCIRLLDIGGVMLADDIFKDGYVAMERTEVPKRQRTTHGRMQGFIHAITHTDGLESSLLTVGKGLAMCTKVKEDVIIAKNGIDGG